MWDSGFHSASAEPVQIGVAKLAMWRDAAVILLAMEAFVRGLC